MTEPLPTTIHIKDIGLPRLLVELKKRRFTGTARVRWNDQDKSLFFKDGDLVFASSRYADDRLGERLLRLGKITLNQYLTSVDLLKKTGKRQGTILVEQGFISPGELFTAVESQVKDILLSLFTWIDGEIEIAEGPLPSEEVITLRISTANVILEGLKRINDWTLLFKTLPSLETVPVKTSNPMILYQEIKLSVPEERFLELIDGQRAILKLFEDSPLPPFETLRMIHFLISIGFIETESPAEDFLSASRAEDAETATAPGAETHASPAPATPSPSISEHPAGAPPAAEATPRPTHAADAIREAYSGLDNKNHYEVLSVPVTATREEIKRAYFRLAREYHPDRHLQEGMEGLKPLLEALFKRVTDAYETLVMESRRREYDSRL